MIYQLTGVTVRKLMFETKEGIVTSKSFLFGVRLFFFVELVEGADLPAREEGWELLVLQLLLDAVVLVL